MIDKIKEMCGEKEKCCNNSHNNSGNAVYCLGLIGAAVYFVGQATSFGTGVIGFLKALVWPAFLVYEVFKNLI